jgi:hypothetical protein
MLEDVRTRGERLHPFWVKIDSAAPRTADSGKRERKTGAEPVSHEH